MNDRLLKSVSIKLQQHKTQLIWVLCLCLLAGVVGTSTYRSLIVEAEAWSKEPVCGLEEHSHGLDCYSLGERPLVCGLEESEGHFHNESCFDEEGNLICGQEEHEGHVHGDECYGEAEPVLICERPEHVHTDACYPAEEAKPEEVLPEETKEGEEVVSGEPEVSKEPDVSEEKKENAGAEEGAEKKDESAEPSETKEEKAEPEENEIIKDGTKEDDETLVFEQKSNGVVVRVSFENDKAFEESDMPVTMKVEPIREDDHKFSEIHDQIIDETEIPRARKMFLFDITFINKDGKEVEPLTTASVSFTTDEIPVPEKEAVEKEEELINVVHITNDGETKVMDVDVKTTEDLHDEEKPDVAFETDSFSIYGVVYTIDFGYELDGVETSFTALGGSVIRIEDMLDQLGISSEAHSAAEITGNITGIDCDVDGLVDVDAEERTITLAKEEAIKAVMDGKDSAALTVTLADDEVFKITLTLTGTPEVQAGEIATISSADGMYLPNDAEGSASILSEEQSSESIQKVEETMTTDSAALSAEEEKPAVQYQVFDISLDNVNTEEYKNGFKVNVNLPEGIQGKDFRLYHIHDDQVTDITDSLVTSNQPADENGLAVVSGFEFVTDGFSEFVLSYTVDFEYISDDGAVHTWKFPGTGSHPLTEVLAELGIEAGVITNADLKLVKIVGETSEKALYLTTDGEEKETITAGEEQTQTEEEKTSEEVNSDANQAMPEETSPSKEDDQSDIAEGKLQGGTEWLINSDEPFDDTYLLTVYADGKKYAITVTDEMMPWSITINLYDYDGSSPATAKEMEQLNGKTYAVVALLKDKDTGETVGYRTTGAQFTGGNSTQCSVDCGTFKEIKFDGNNWQEQWDWIVDYDPDKYYIDFRLYEGNENVDQWQHKPFNNLIKLPDSVTGFEFLAAPNGNITNITNHTTVLNLKRAYDKRYNVRFNINPEGLTVAQTDRYYVFITVDHQTTGVTYAYGELVVSPDQDVVDIPVNQWYDQNLNPKQNEKFTGNETVKVEIFTTNKNQDGTKPSLTLNQLKNEQNKVLVGEGASINQYNVHYENRRTHEEHDDIRITEYYDNLTLSAPDGSISKGYIDRYLEDATDFGYYTLRYLGQQGDIEATIAADYVEANFGSDYGYSTSNVNVNRLKVMKIFTNSQGDPVSKPVTIRLKQNGSVVAEASGTTGSSDGILELEFENLNAGVYQIEEVLDGHAVSGTGNVIINNNETVYYNFSKTEARFVNNLNINYFGKIGPNQNMENLVEKGSSRVDVVFITDTQADKDRIEAQTQIKHPSHNVDVVINGTDPYKHYDIPSDMQNLKQLSDQLASAQSSKTVRIINLKASEMSENGLKLDDDGRYIVLNIEMDRDTFCPLVVLDGVELNSDYGQSGKANSSRVLYNLRSNGNCYSGDVNTSKLGAGVILAPEGKARNLGSTFGGTIIAAEVNRYGNELHSNNPNQIQTLNATIQNVVGQPSTGSLELNKVFSDSSIKDRITYFTFEVALANDDSSLVNGKTFPASGLKSGNSVTFDENGKALILVRAGNSVSITKLPVGTTYTVTEVETPETEHFTVDHYEVDGVATNTGSITSGETSHATVFNKTKSGPGALKLKKQVTVNGSSTTSKKADGDYTFTVTGTGVSKTVVITVTDGVAASATLDGAAVDLDANGFVVISNLNPGEYTITETVPDNGTSISKINGEETTSYSTKVTVEAGDTIAEHASAAFTNNISISSTELGIVKVDEANHTIRLNGAVFQLQEIDGESTSISKKGDSVTKTTENNGTLTYINLGDGYYQIKETTPPHGYVIVGEDTFYIKIENGVVIPIAQEQNVAPKNWNEQHYTDSDKYFFTAKSGDTPATMRVSNTQGAELPHTGGPGTTIFTTLGMILIATAGILLLRRKRKGVMDL